MTSAQQTAGLVTVQLTIAKSNVTTKQAAVATAQTANQAVTKAVLAAQAKLNGLTNQAQTALDVDKDAEADLASAKATVAALEAKLAQDTATVA